MRSLGSIAIVKAASFWRRYNRMNWALVDQALVSGSNFLTTIVAARLLGFEEFGQYALAFLILLFANSVHLAFNSEPMMSIGPIQEKHPNSQYFCATIIQQIVFSIISGFLVFILLLVISGYFDQFNLSKIAISIAFAIAFSQLQDFFRKYFYTRQKPFHATAIDLIRYFSQFIFIILVHITIGISPNWMFFTIAASCLLSSIWGWRLMEPVKFDRQATKEVVRRHWRSSRYLVLSALLMWFAGHLFTLASGAMLGAASVAAIFSCMSLLNMLNVLFLTFENVIAVEASVKKRMGQLRQYLVKVGAIGTVTTLIFIFPFFMWPEFLLRITFGEEYVQFGYLLRWLSGIAVLRFIFNLYHAGCRAIEQTRPILIAYLCSALFSVTSTYFLLKHIGLDGVLVSRWAAMVIEFTVVAILFHRRLSKLAQ